MNPKQENLALAGICAIVVLLSLGGLAWAVVTRLIFDIDGLLLALICLTMAGIFSLQLFLLAGGADWLKSLLARRKK